MSRQLSWQHLVKPVALVAAYFACLAGMVYLMDRVETARAEARVIGWTQSLVWESLDAPAYARFTQPIIEPAEGTGWNLTGEIRVPDLGGTFVAQPYQAKVRIVCSPSRNRECWELTGLSVGDSDLTAVEPTAVEPASVEPASVEPASASSPPAVSGEPTEQTRVDQQASANAPTIEDSQMADHVVAADPAPTAPPQTAVELLEARLSALAVEPGAGPKPAKTADPFSQSGYRHAGLDGLEKLDTGSGFETERIETVAAGLETAPDGYPPIPTRKPL